jgi:carbohydrate-binding DOMON domain-containing protein
MYVPSIPEKLTLNGLDIPWKWTKYSVIEFLIPLSAETAEQKLVLKLSPFPSEIRETKTLTITKTVLSQETVIAYATRTVTAAPATITATVTSRETTTVHETKTITVKETFWMLSKEAIPTILLLLTAAITGLLVVATVFMKKRKTKHG